MAFLEMLYTTVLVFFRKLILFFYNEILNKTFLVSAACFLLHRRTMLRDEEFRRRTVVFEDELRSIREHLVRIAAATDILVAESQKRKFILIFLSFS